LVIKQACDKLDNTYLWERSEILVERDCLGDPRIDGSIILKISILETGYKGDGWVKTENHGRICSYENPVAIQI
jgi:hypothetical protein